MLNQQVFFELVEIVRRRNERNEMQIKMFRLHVELYQQNSSGEAIVYLN